MTEMAQLPLSRLDLEPDDMEVYWTAFDERFRHLWYTPDWSGTDVLCVVENTIRRERGLIPS